MTQQQPMMFLLLLMAALCPFKSLFTFFNTVESLFAQLSYLFFLPLAVFITILFFCHSFSHGCYRRPKFSQNFLANFIASCPFQPLLALLKHFAISQVFSQFSCRFLLLPLAFCLSLLAVFQSLIFPLLLPSGCFPSFHSIFQLI